LNEQINRVKIKQQIKQGQTAFLTKTRNEKSKAKNCEEILIHKKKKTEPISCSAHGDTPCEEIISLGLA